MTFSVLRAKKAKFGFKKTLYGADDIVFAGNAIVFSKACSDVRIEYDTNYGKSELKLYTDNEAFARHFEQTWC